jgi:DNA-binding GntR family transcriptional regulator
MTRLSDEHLLDIFRQSKTMVARINLEELHTVFLLRNAMKNDLAERLAQGVSPADFE